VTERKVINGVELQPGDRVSLPLASAHRDEEIYRDADQILIDRPEQKSMVFGAGSHRCLGSHLARLEMTIALEEILRRIPRFSLPEDAQLAAYGGQTRSLAVLPFRTWRD
jgi:cytochrome P450